jgi:hypothetical protein
MDIFMYKSYSLVDLFVTHEYLDQGLCDTLCVSFQHSQQSERDEINWIFFCKADIHVTKCKFSLKYNSYCQQPEMCHTAPYCDSVYG